MRDTITLAFDQSVRRFDEYGRLHVEIANISKGNISPYWGREIPAWDSLGLDPNRIYRMLRDPAELAAAAKTFNGVPLLSEHVPHSADEPQKQTVVGSLGTDAAFTGPYLRNSLVIWDSTAIALVESGEQKQLSAAYGYVPVMSPGNFQGERFDGRMTQIRANHVALVSAGRAGSDVVVGDSALEGKPHMTERLSRQAAMAAGALQAYIRPLLARDTALDINPMLAGITRRNWPERKPLLVAAVRTAATGKLAKDATLAELDQFLDQLDGGEAAPPLQDNAGMPQSAADDTEDLLGVDDDDDDDAPPKPPAGDPPPPDAPPPAAAPPDDAAPLPPDAAPPPPDAAVATEPVDKALAFLKDLIRPEDIAMVAHILKPSTPAPVVPPPAAPPPAAITKGAMDAAIAAAVKATETATIARIRSIHDAETFVRPWVGSLAIAQDSAEAVYKTALTTLGVDGLAEMHPSAYRAVLAAQPRPADPQRPARRGLAQDGAAPKGMSFAERFPQASAVRVL